MVTAWAYGLGIVPAAVTGLAWGGLCMWMTKHHVISLSARTAIGALIGATSSAAFSLLSVPRDGNLVAELSIAAGTIAGGILARRFPKPNPILSPSNKSLERSRER